MSQWIMDAFKTGTLNCHVCALNKSIKEFNNNYTCKSCECERILVSTGDFTTEEAKKIVELIYSCIRGQLK